VYVLVSGHADASQFGSTFTSDLLWYRLFPSPTSGIGVLPIGLIVSLPLLVLIAVTWLRGRAGWYWLRLLGIGGMILALFAGGLVVSTKIGGGSNIHNLDAYLVLLLVTGAYVLFNRPRTEQNAPQAAWLPWLLALAIACLPVLWNIPSGRPFQRPDTRQAASDLAVLQEKVNEYASRGEILFITQRQVQVFNLVRGAPLVADYELLTLSEMAISNNTTYLDRFAGDLANHRFVLIVSDTQREVTQDPRVDAFAEENNAWVEHISRPILAYYQTDRVLDASDIHLYVPKP
jgi:hypothetical protein